MGAWAGRGAGGRRCGQRHIVRASEVRRICSAFRSALPPAPPLPAARSSTLPSPDSTPCNQIHHEVRRLPVQHLAAVVVLSRSSHSASAPGRLPARRGQIRPLVYPSALSTPTSWSPGRASSTHPVSRPPGRRTAVGRATVGSRSSVCLQYGQRAFILATPLSACAAQPPRGGEGSPPRARRYHERGDRQARAAQV